MGEDILPTVDYPPMIRGSLRLMLQVKDAFLGSFNLVEEYRDQLLACKHGFTRDLVEYQLTKGLAGITRLREDLASVETEAQGRLKRNVALREYLLQRYGMPSPGSATTGIVNRIGVEPDGDPNRSGTGTAVIGPSLPPPINAPDSVEQALHGGLTHHKFNVDVDNLDIPPEVDLATATTDSGTHLLPVVDFYRGFFFLQMHFQLIMCQAANYAMPVVTRPMSLSERTFSWPTMPSFGLAATSGSMKDRLLEIHTDVTVLAKRLQECLRLVREKMAQDQKIESYFMQHTNAQEALRRNLLRGLQAQRVYIELLEGQNDRLAGLAIKLDPNFAKSPDFAIMTGSGLVFQDTSNNPQKLTANQNSATTATGRASKKRDGRKPDDDSNAQGGWRNSKGGGFRGGVDQNSNYKYYPQRPGNTGTRRSNGFVTDKRSSEVKGTEEYGESRDTATNSDVDVQESEMNMSASGGGHPPVWVKHGKTDPRGHGNDFQKPVNVDVEFTGKLDQLRGHSQAVEQLLIGVDSTVHGRRTRGYDQYPTPSFLNTDHHVPSILDDVLGQASQDPTAQKSANPSKAPSRTSKTPNLCTPSTRYSFVEPLSPAASVEQPIITVLSPTSERTTRNTETSLTRGKQSELQREQSDEVGLSDDTMSRVTPSAKYFSPRGRELVYGAPDQLDTNVNASHVAVPRMVTQENRMRPRLSRATRSSSASVGSASQPSQIQDRKACYRHEAETEFHDSTDTFSETDISVQNVSVEGKLRQANECQLRQVPTVGSTECGQLCIPEWIARRGSGKVHKAEDLLAEPKRSAFNKAVMAHRCRLVETILQADEERLEELISVLLRD
ncbi:hypothetical protein T265_05216 [Opisthorchis viverrini]|uniref:DUF5743 domain-containing protein n=1 Tax=Opisthorchis viverrini TaxID=6198 RepID=A0A075AFI7_OPIVI|nr:hypothetical protein T265_05216 [Opisthorchis viverrini]KER27789.1 hypothetical protein T265_05216 [Opisthorchis viverrini]